MHCADWDSMSHEILWRMGYHLAQRRLGQRCRSERTLQPSCNSTEQSMAQNFDSVFTRLWNLPISSDGRAGIETPSKLLFRFCVRLSIDTHSMCAEVYE